MLNAVLLQVLNVYCDDLASGRAVRDAHVTFLVKQPASQPVTETPLGTGASQTKDKLGSKAGTPEPLRRIDATLPARGSLAPLLHAFGLLSSDELAAQETSGSMCLLSWLNFFIQSVPRKGVAP